MTSKRYIVKEVKNDVLVDSYLTIALHYTTKMYLDSVKVLDYERNNKGSMLLYNLATMKNSKIKIYTQDKSREK